MMTLSHTASTEGADSESNTYELRSDRRAERDLSKLPAQDFARIDPRILDLSANPRPSGTVKLRDNIYRIRVGPWRVLYLVDDQARKVIVSRVTRREKDTYR